MFPWSKIFPNVLKFRDIKTNWAHLHTTSVILLCLLIALHCCISSIHTTFTGTLHRTSYPFWSRVLTLSSLRTIIIHMKLLTANWTTSHHAREADESLAHLGLCFVVWAYPESPSWMPYLRDFRGLMCIFLFQIGTWTCSGKLSFLILGLNFIIKYGEEHG